MLYKNIAKKLRFRINSDEFAIGDVLPTERQLMEEYQASRVSIRNVTSRFAMERIRNATVYPLAAE